MTERERMELTFFNESVVELIDVSASDESVARAAWVSTMGEESRTKDIDKIFGLINFLMRDRHGSPFEHNQFKFLIKTPLFVRSEFHRHRIGWSYNEESGRYSQMKPHFYVIPSSRNIIQTGKVGHYNFVPGDPETVQYIQESMKEDSEYLYNSYVRKLERGVAREVARETLPLNLMTSFYATCNARSLMSFLALRTKDSRATYPSNPQWEINDVASKMEDFFRQEMPITYESWNANGRVAP